MNSCLYDCTIMHSRVKPKRHQFSHKIFMFYLDLDEIDVLTRQNKWLGHNSRRIYDFRDTDHIDLKAGTIKENVRAYLKQNHVDWPGGRVMLLTNVRSFGYIFNPVSFYICFDQNDKPSCVVTEIGNTFGELKPYIIKNDKFLNNRFFDTQTKFYYISPFIDMDLSMVFNIKIPDEKLNIDIDDIDKSGEKLIYTTMRGQRWPLDDRHLWRATLKYPFVTLKVIGLIHMHAVLLFLKGLPFWQKTDQKHLQQGVFREWNKK